MNILLFEEAEVDGPLEGGDSRAAHLVKILRKGAGDEFDAGLIGGKRGKGRIERIAGDGSVLFSLDLCEAPPPRLPVHIGVGFSRPIQLRRILRDLSSMGVAAISIFGTDLGEKSYRDTKLIDGGGARAALVEGAVQSRDTALPVLGVCGSVDEWLEGAAGGASPGTALIFADNGAPEGSFADLPRLEGGAAVAIGSERGWSDRERVMFRAAGFRGLSLGSRALRTETACVAAAALVLRQVASWRGPALPAAAA